MFGLKSIWLIFIYLNLFSAFAQLNETFDPVLKFKKFNEIGFAISSVSVQMGNTLYNDAQISNVQYSANYLDYEFSYNYGWIVNSTSSQASLVKIGVYLPFLSCNYEVDEIIDKHSTLFLKIPLQYGFRLPLNRYNSNQEIFRSVEINFGLYGATPLLERLVYEEEFFAVNYGISGAYLRCGFITELYLTTQNNEGNGQKYGLRASIDFNSFNQLYRTKYNIYPLYYSFSFFYNLWNEYR